MDNLINLRAATDKSTRLNVLNQALDECSCEPLTGWFRDGKCATDENDHGRHVVCAIMTDKFLEFAKSRGNDLITPRHDFDFPGLKAGDHWCVCAKTWQDALEADAACTVVLESTHMSALEVIALEDLQRHASKSLPIN